MLTVDSLKAFGANTDEGLSRCFGKDAFYLKLVKIIPGDANFDKLQEALAQNDLDAGFEAAHALKGVLSNLSLTPILDPVTEITELLRSRTDTDYSALVAEVLKQREILRELCAE